MLELNSTGETITHFARRSTFFTSMSWLTTFESKFYCNIFSIGMFTTSTTLYHIITTPICRSSLTRFPSIIVNIGTATHRTWPRWAIIPTVGCPFVIAIITSHIVFSPSHLGCRLKGILLTYPKNGDSIQATDRTSEFAYRENHNLYFIRNLWFIRPCSPWLGSLSNMECIQSERVPIWCLDVWLHPLVSPPSQIFCSRNEWHDQSPMSISHRR